MNDCKILFIIICVSGVSKVFVESRKFNIYPSPACITANTCIPYDEVPSSVLTRKVPALSALILYFLTSVCSMIVLVSSRASPCSKDLANSGKPVRGSSTGLSSLLTKNFRSLLDHVSEVNDLSQLRNLRDRGKMIMSVSDTRLKKLVLVS